MNCAPGWAKKRRAANDPRSHSDSSRAGRVLGLECCRLVAPRGCAALKLQTANYPKGASASGAPLLLAQSNLNLDLSPSHALSCVAGAAECRNPYSLWRMQRIHSLWRVQRIRRRPAQRIASSRSSRRRVAQRVASSESSRHSQTLTASALR